MNLYYTPTGNPIDNTRGIAQLVRDEVALIAAGFDKLPDPEELVGGAVNYYADTGAVNAYVITADALIVGYTAGLTFLVKATNANTGASTINVSGLGARPIVRADGSALQAGDIMASQIIQISYDLANTRFQLNASGAAASATAAAASATTATTQAGIATTQAGTATTQAGIATTQAGLAATAKTDAEAARDLALVYAAALQGTSASSVLIGTGAKSFTASTSKQWSTGQYLQLASAANPAVNFMHGSVTSYNSSTGALVMNITDVGGSGTLADWLISVSGTRGATGATGSAGNNGMVCLAANTVTSAATLDLTSLIDSTYDQYFIYLRGFVPASGAATLLMRTSSNNGSSFDSTANDYSYARFSSDTGGGSGAIGSVVATSILLHTTAASTTASHGGVSAAISLITPSNTTMSKQIEINRITVATGAGTFESQSGSAVRNSTSAINAVRFLFNTGNIASGSYQVFGLRKTV